jgi:hypothetical protein
MNVKRIVILVALSTLPGCAFFGYGICNVVEEPVDALDELFARCRFRAMANAAWNEVASKDAPHVYSADYARGFKDGFVDYLDANGPGEPPAAPPWCYRRANHETPDGLQAIEDWFAGFRHGASAAQATGYRQFVAIPLAAQPRGPEGAPRVQAGLQPGMDLAPAEPLPPPRKLGPSQSNPDTNRKDPGQDR